MIIFVEGSVFAVKAVGPNQLPSGNQIGGYLVTISPNIKNLISRVNSFVITSVNRIDEFSCQFWKYSLRFPTLLDGPARTASATYQCDHPNKCSSHFKKFSPINCLTSNHLKSVPSMCPSRESQLIPYSLGSTGSLSSAKTLKTHSWTCRSGRFSTNRFSPSEPSANSRIANDRFEAIPRLRSLTML